MSGDQTSIRMRSAASTHMIFGAFVWPMAALYSYLVFTKTPAAWQALVLIAAVACFWHLYFGYLQLSVSSGVLTYRTLFRQQSVPLAAIICSELQRNPHRRDPRVYLAIIPMQGEVVRVHLKPFRLDEIRQLLTLPELRVRYGDDVA